MEVGVIHDCVHPRSMNDQGRISDSSCVRKKTSFQTHVALEEACARHSPNLPILWSGIDAGWSSLAARRAHNPKVVGSNPTPATIVV